MDPIVEVVAVLLGFIGWVMVGVCLPNRYWRTSTVDGNVITTSTIYENLWMSCATDSTGVHNCREFPSLLALSGMLEIKRRSALITQFFYSKEVALLQHTLVLCQEKCNYVIKVCWRTGFYGHPCHQNRAKWTNASESFRD